MVHTRDNDNIEAAKHVRGVASHLSIKKMAVIEKKAQYVTLLENTTVFTNITNNNAFLSCVEFVLEVKEVNALLFVTGRGR